MGEPNAALNVYMSKKERIRDVFEYYMGERIPSGYEIRTEDGFYSLKDKGKLTFRERDELKKIQWEEGKGFFLGIENQMTVNLTFPQRLLEMDSLEYKRQAEEIRKENNKAGVTYTKADDFKYGFRKEDRLKPVCNLKLYWGKDNPKLPASLEDIMDMESMPESMKSLFNNYKVHTVRVLQIQDEALDRMESDVKYVVGVLKRAGKKKEYQEFMREHEEYFRRIPLDAFDVINVCVNVGKLEKYLKFKDENGEERADMCKALDELMEEGWREGQREGQREGEKEGFRRGKQEAIFELLEEFGEIPEKIKKQVVKEDNMEILKIWHKIAAKSESMEEFCLAVE